MVYVTLTRMQLDRAYRVGCRRHIIARERDMRPLIAYGTIAERLHHDVVGAAAELAAAEALDLEWPGTIDPDDRNAPDIPPDWQVRMRLEHDRDLIVREYDRDDQRFILVTGLGPTFRVHGWLFGAEAKRIGVRQDRGNYGLPAWWVPQSALVPIVRAFAKGQT
jgi:hypothetical protein